MRRSIIAVIYIAILAGAIPGRPPARAALAFDAGMPAIAAALSPPLLMTRRLAGAGVPSAASA